MSEEQRNKQLPAMEQAVCNSSLNSSTLEIRLFDSSIFQISVININSSNYRKDEGQWPYLEPLRWMGVGATAVLQINYIIDPVHYKA